MTKRMRRFVGGATLLAGLMIAAPAPAGADDGIPANNGCGMAYGAEVSSAAQALRGFGPDAGPPTHQGLHGIKADICGGG